METASSLMKGLGTTARGATQHFLCVGDYINIASGDNAIAARSGGVAGERGGGWPTEDVPLISDAISLP